MADATHTEILGDDGGMRAMTVLNGSHLTMAVIDTGSDMTCIVSAEINEMLADGELTPADRRGFVDMGLAGGVKVRWRKWHLHHLSAFDVTWFGVDIAECPSGNNLLGIDLLRRTSGWTVNWRTGQIIVEVPSKPQGQWVTPKSGPWEHLTPRSPR
jgi:hypothetical protein